MGIGIGKRGTRGGGGGLEGMFWLSCRVAQRPPGISCEDDGLGKYHYIGSDVKGKGEFWGGVKEEDDDKEYDDRGTI